MTQSHVQGMSIDFFPLTLCLNASPRNLNYHLLVPSDYHQRSIQHQADCRIRTHRQMRVTLRGDAMMMAHNVNECSLSKTWGGSMRVERVHVHRVSGLSRPSSALTRLFFGHCGAGNGRYVTLSHRYTWSMNKEAESKNYSQHKNANASDHSYLRPTLFVMHMDIEV